MINFIMRIQTVSDDKQLMGSIVNDFRADTSREIFFCVFKSGRIRWMGCV